jgi:hypothetical protein
MVYVNIMVDCQKFTKSIFKDFNLSGIHDNCTIRATKACALSHEKKETRTLGYR